MDGQTRSRRHALRVIVALAVAGSLTVMLFPSVSASGDETACAHGTRQAVTAGIVKATACWTQATVSGATVYTAAFADNPAGIDLNGLVITGDTGNGVQINASTRAVTSVQISSGTSVRVQLNSRNWPVQGAIRPLGSPFAISFVAPLNGSMLLTDVRFGSNSIGGALAGLSPVGTVDTPVMLENGGGGSMDLTIALAGIFTLKDKPQSVTIALPTEPEEGTKLDGFELKLKELDGIKFIALYDLEAKYSASQKLISGSATLGFPFFGEGKGIGVSFTIQNGVLTDLGVNIHGTHIPIGAAGFITDVGGGFHISGVVPANFDGYCKSIGYEGAVIIGGETGADAFAHWKCHRGSANDGIDVTKACRWQTGNPISVASYNDPNKARSWVCSGALPTDGTQFDLSANATLGAEFGPVIPTPFGDVNAVRADTKLELGSQGGQFLLALHGNLRLLNLPVGDAYLIIHGNSGVEFGAGIGIGLPSFTNDDNQPFYLGLRVDGWVGRGKFQFEGKGKFALFGAKLLEGDGLINDQGIGACWTVLTIPGGAFYKWGSSGPETFGTSCGLDRYREQFPAGGVATAAGPRSFTIGVPKTVLAVRGAGAAPRFELRSGGGRIIRAPTTANSVVTAGYAVFVNRFAKTTYVVLPHARGRWTITPYPRSVEVTSVKAAHIAPKQRVAAKVLGTGTTRTLVYSSVKIPSSRLLFLEVLPNGTQFPILNTAAASGRYRFRLETGSGYGTRRLRVVVMQGNGSTGSRVLARYRVNPPSILPASRSVDATRDGFAVYAAWDRVRSASAYLVQVSTRERGRLVASFVRRVPARTTTLWLPTYPATPGRSTVTVWALNTDGRPGRPKSASFFTSASALTLRAAAKLSIQSAFAGGGAVNMITQCPANQGHCQVRLTVFLNGRAIVRRGYQQSPGTLLTVHLKPANPALRRALARALNTRSGRAHVRVTCRMFRLAQPGAPMVAGLP